MTANRITYSRILLSAVLLFLPTVSIAFGIVYLLCGFSDMADGLVARKTHTESEKGARLDSIADLVFVAVCAVKLLPLIRLDAWLWIWIGLIALIKLTNLAAGYIRKGRPEMPHTWANKLTGLLLFILPAAMQLVNITYPATFICAVASFAAVQEGVLIRKDRT